jgi:hypothetical protein
MSMAWRSEEGTAERERPMLNAVSGGDGSDPVSELQRLRDENRRLAVSLGGFSAFIASRGLLEEAWDYVNSIHQLDED